VTFDHVAVEQRGVAGPGAFRYSMLLFEFGQLRILCEIDARGPDGSPTGTPKT
jgi:hypothetical protein